MRVDVMKDALTSCLSSVQWRLNKGVANPEHGGACFACLLACLPAWLVADLPTDLAGWFGFLQFARHPWVFLAFASAQKMKKTAKLRR